MIIEEAYRKTRSFEQTSRSFGLIGVYRTCFTGRWLVTITKKFDARSVQFVDFPVELTGSKNFNWNWKIEWTNWTSGREKFRFGIWIQSLDAFRDVQLFVIIVCTAGNRSVAILDPLRFSMGCNPLRSTNPPQTVTVYCSLFKSICWGCCLVMSDDVDCSLNVVQHQLRFSNWISVAAGVQLTQWVPGASNTFKYQNTVEDFI